MLKAVECDTKDMDKNYIISKLVPLLVDFVSYMDDIAGEVGVGLNLAWLFFTDYILFKRVLWGPVTAYQYSITSPGHATPSSPSLNACSSPSRPDSPGQPEQHPPLTLTPQRALIRHSSHPNPSTSTHSHTPPPPPPRLS